MLLRAGALGAPAPAHGRGGRASKRLHARAVASPAAPDAQLAAPRSAKPRVVVLGSGWGAVSFVKAVAPVRRASPQCALSRRDEGGALVRPLLRRCACASRCRSGRRVSTGAARALARAPVARSSAHPFRGPSPSLRARSDARSGGALLTSRCAHAQDNVDVSLVSPRNYFLYR
jgi:hypothetical protein